MYMTSPHKNLLQGNKAVDPGMPMNDVLCYADQGSFMGLRALGRQPLLIFTWCYERRLDETTVNKFNDSLAKGQLGRLVQRSPLPWGRHRWVANPVAAPVTWYPGEIPAGGLEGWRNALVHLPVDPEFGPGWRLAVQPMEGGRSALSLIISHTIADAKGGIEAIIEAISGTRRRHGFPVPSWRWSPIRLARDIAESLRALPDVARAVAALVRGAGIPASQKSVSFVGTVTPDSSQPLVDVPLAHVMMDLGIWEKRASELGVTTSSLFMAFAARIAHRIGRVDSEGRAKLVLPVSYRLPGDRRGNALSAVMVMANPDLCPGNFSTLRQDFKTALATLFEQGDDKTPLFALLPYVPLWLVRRLERLALRTDQPIGCSLLGAFPPELSNPCGPASLVRFSGIERCTAEVLEWLGGKLYLITYSVGDQMHITITGYMVDRITTLAAFVPFVREALDDLSLEGSVN
jgi:diacylglycerol O-acyltransferase